MSNEVHEGHPLFHAAGIVTIVQFVLIFFFSNPKISALLYTGWGIWVVSLVLGWLPVRTLRTKGNVPEGESYVKTKTVVDTGIYSIVRHPQYTALILFNAALMLITQHWIVVVVGAVSIILAYVSTLQEDQALLRKFGSDYQQYMEDVPRTNVLLGMYKKLTRTA